MTKLIVFSDRALTHPISGSEFPESPTDQQLFPGVLERIEALRSEGWTISISSNQLDCDWHIAKAADLEPGSIFKEIGSENPDNRTFIVEEFIDEICEWDVIVRAQPDDTCFYFKEEESVLICHKTIESAIEEVQYAADLCGIAEAVLCPVMDGSELYSLVRGIEYGWRSMKALDSDYEYLTGQSNSTYRKSGPGMLLYLEGLCTRPKRCVMVGVGTDDREAANAAGFEFVDAEEWRSPFGSRF